MPKVAIGGHPAKASIEASRADNACGNHGWSVRWALSSKAAGLAMGTDHLATFWLVFSQFNASESLIAGDGRP